MTNKALKQWQAVSTDWSIVTDRVAKFFVTTYFGSDVDYYWVADEIGGVIDVSDYFFGLSDMVDYLRHNYAKKDVFEHYDYCLRQAMNNKKVEFNIRHFRQALK